MVEVAKKKKCRQGHDECGNYNGQQRQLQAQIDGLPLQDNTLSYTARTPSSFDLLHEQRPQIPIWEKQKESPWLAKASHIGNRINLVLRELLPLHKARQRCHLVANYTQGFSA